MIGVQQLSDPNAKGPTYLVLVAGANAAPGGTNGLPGSQFGEPFFLDMVRKNDMGMIADNEVVADGNAGRSQLGDFFKEAHRIDNETVADDRTHVRLQNAGRQQGEFEGLTVLDDGMAG